MFFARLRARVRMNERMAVRAVALERMVVHAPVLFSLCVDRSPPHARVRSYVRACTFVSPLPCLTVSPDTVRLSARACASVVLFSCGFFRVLQAGKILAACDSVRDDALPQLGVRLEDGAEGELSCNRAR